MCSPTPTFSLGSTVKGWVLCTPGSWRYCELDKSYFPSLHLDSSQAPWGWSNIEIDLRSNFRPTKSEAVLVMLFHVLSQLQQFQVKMLFWPLIFCEKIFSWPQTAVNLSETDVVSSCRPRYCSLRFRNVLEPQHII